MIRQNFTNHQIIHHALNKERRVQLFVEGVEQKVPFDPNRMTAALTRFLRGKGIHKQIQVILVNDEYIADLNRRYRRVEGATDVLAFDLGPSERSDDEAEGEVYVSLDRAQRQAKDLNIPMAEESVRLIIHGLLHLSGYDHEEGREAEKRMLKETEAGVKQVLKEMDITS
ncbi:MAG: rRNA maturation RNase YbeY [Candidatus Latescibacteria bacterium 4484_107]|nr:MAG: rRNA maturation RNase YbeY [Candidatus Latescibacteria bacterium 4484_107]